MCLLLPGQQVLAITENGYGKRTDPDEYREQGRNGKGIKAMNLTDKTGALACQLLVHRGRGHPAHHRRRHHHPHAGGRHSRAGRNTQGVRLMRIAEGSEDRRRSPCRAGAGGRRDRRDHRNFRRSLRAGARRSDLGRFHGHGRHPRRRHRHLAGAGGDPLHPTPRP